MEKNQLDIRMLNFMLDILEKKKKKKNSKNLEAEKSSPDPENFQ